MLTEENPHDRENCPRKWVPEYEGTLRSHMIKIPTCISECSGIRVFGRRIKSLAFTTDVAVIRNINADAVMAVYPFTPQPAIHRAVMQAADMPVFVGVGGGVTRGLRVVNLANDAEHEGAFGVVVNAPTQNDVVRRLKQVLDIPVVVTVVSPNTDIAARLEAGADILNISGAGTPPRSSGRCGRSSPTSPSSPPADPPTRAFWRPSPPGPTPLPTPRPAVRICSPFPCSATARNRGET